MGATAPFRATVAEIGGRLALVSVSGELDLYIESELRDAVGAAASLRSPTVVVDLSGASFMDSTVCGILVAEASACDARAPSWSSSRTAIAPHGCSRCRESIRLCRSTRRCTPPSGRSCWSPSRELGAAENGRHIASTEHPRLVVFHARHSGRLR